MLPKSDFKNRLQKIKLFLFDLDGVLILNKGKNEDDIYNCMTDFAKKLKEYNFGVGIVTARDDDELTSKLAGIDNCIMVSASFNKVGKVEKLIEKLKLSFENVLYIGDDMLDIPLLQKAGVAIAPSNARREVKRIVDLTVDNTVNGSILNSVLNVIERYLK